MLYEHILATARALTINLGTVPSLDTVARAAVVSKGGLMHHFPTRSSLVEALAISAIDDVDSAMNEAAETGTTVETWLRLSMPIGEDLTLYSAMLPALGTDGIVSEELRERVTESGRRWQSAMAAELGGDDAAALVVRLVGDGLAMNAIAGVVIEIDLQQLVRRVTTGAGS